MKRAVLKWRLHALRRSQLRARGVCARFHYQQRLQRRCMATWRRCVAVTNVGWEVQNRALARIKARALGVWREVAEREVMVNTCKVRWRVSVGVGVGA